MEENQRSVGPSPARGKKAHISSSVTTVYHRRPAKAEPTCSWGPSSPSPLTLSSVSKIYQAKHELLLCGLLSPTPSSLPRSDPISQVSSLAADEGTEFLWPGPWWRPTPLLLRLGFHRRGRPASRWWWVTGEDWGLCASTLLSPVSSTASQHVLRAGYRRALGWGAGWGFGGPRSLLCHTVRSTEGPVRQVKGDSNNNNNLQICKANGPLPRGYIIFLPVMLTLGRPTDRMPSPLPLRVWRPATLSLCVSTHQSFHFTHHFSSLPMWVRRASAAVRPAARPPRPAARDQSCGQGSRRRRRGDHGSRPSPRCSG
jgi:hypothetical protein